MIAPYKSANSRNESCNSFSFSIFFSSSFPLVEFWEFQPEDWDSTPGSLPSKDSEKDLVDLESATNQSRDNGFHKNLRDPGDVGTKHAPGGGIFDRKKIEICTTAKENIVMTCDIQYIYINITQMIRWLMIWKVGHLLHSKLRVLGVVGDV